MLPGIGDIYWVAVALQDLMRQHGWKDVELTVWDFDGRRRSEEFVQRIPFVRSGGYYERKPHPHKLKEFHQSYHSGERSIFPGLFGFDFYIAPNGALRHGQTVEHALQARCDWYLPLRQTPAELSHRMVWKAQDPYVVCHFSEFGMFRPWVQAWGVDGCAQLLRRVHEATGLQMILTGCSWDTPFNVALMEKAGPGVVNLCGETDPADFFAMLREAAGVLGWCGGNTILATAFRVPTLIAWSRKAFPDPHFFHHACPPDALGQHYTPVVVENHTPRKAADLFLRLLTRNFTRVPQVTP